MQILLNSQTPSPVKISVCTHPERRSKLLSGRYDFKAKLPTSKSPDIKCNSVGSSLIPLLLQLPPPAWREIEINDFFSYRTNRTLFMYINCKQRP